HRGRAGCGVYSFLQSLCLLRRLWLGRQNVPAPAGFTRLPASLARLPVFLDRSDDALGQEQCDGDEEAAEREEPEFRERAGEEALSSIHQNRADDWTHQRSA